LGLPTLELQEAAMAKEPGGESRRTRWAPARQGETRTDADHAQNLAQRGEDLKKDLDAVLDDIDEVLEENAEEFVRSYVQKGGQ